MSAAGTLDAAWARAHPLPDLDGAIDKNARGQLLLAGGGVSAPAALLLTAEAGFRAGAGRVRIATDANMVPHMVAALPEAGWVPLPTTSPGDYGAEALDLLDAQRADAVVVGTGMGDRKQAVRLAERLLVGDQDRILLLDAAACACAGPLAEAIARYGRVVLTPHPGEMAELIGSNVEAVCAAQEATARDAASRFGAVVALRSVETIVAAPDGRTLRYAGGGAGLATGGSGDVASGIIGGLLARGTDPFVATAWGVLLHGEAGRMLGGPGFLARELLPLVPGLLKDLG